jgi:hypothetical protein
MLQREDERAAGVVVAHRGASAVEMWRGGKASAAQPAGPKIEIERVAATGTARRAEEGDVAPAAGTKRTGCGDWHAASETVRRQQQIEQTVARAAQPRSRGESEH